VEREFWLDRWQNQEIGFHQPAVNPWLQKCWPEFDLPAGSGVFVPLCGKSLDLGWLASQGHEVYGVELAETAVRAYFEEAEQPCRVERMPHLQRFVGGPVTLYCGDFMDLTVLHLPRVQAVYDRAALVALPPRMRAHYADHLLRIVPDGCRILLLTLEYDQKRVPGPPHAVLEDEVRALFGERCEIESCCRAPARALPPKFAEAGVDEAVEAVYRMVKTA
tara:strand:+ start:7620 stop:8279 length:660 start_codon:yes stop_codon:yes gene_type:complete